jgi:hypothetical protein
VCGPRLGGIWRGEIVAEYLAAVSVRARTPYGHGMVPRPRLDIETQDVARLVSGIVGMCEGRWVA